MDSDKTKKIINISDLASFLRRCRRRKGIMSNIPTFKFAFVFFMVTSSWTLLSILTAVVPWSRAMMPYQMGDHTHEQRR